MKRSLRNLLSQFISEPLKGTYAQAGEDAIIKFLFDSKGVVQPSYLELGTNKPDAYNNTYLFYKLNSRGVCVEADETLIDSIKKVRPGDKVIHAGVSVQNGEESDFYIFNEPSLNTFNKAEAESRERKGTYKMVKVTKVKLLAVNKLISENFSAFPDFLSIDIEGLDMEVLRTLDYSSYPIPVICAETCTYSENHIKPKNEEIARFLIEKGYFIYADTYINTIFVNKTWFYN